MQVGPQLDYVVDGDSDGFKKLGLGLLAGIGYDISDNFFASIRYSFGLTNRLDETQVVVGPNGNPFVADVDLKIKLNFFQVGIGYIF